MITYSDVAPYLPDTNANIAAALTAKTVTTRSSTPVTVAKIVASLSEADALTVLGTIKTVAAQDPRIDSTWIAMSSVGVDLSGDDRQAMIDVLAAAGSWSAETTTIVKELGVKTSLQFPGGVTEQEVADTIADYEAEQARTARIGWMNLAQAFATQDITDTSTEAEIVALFTARLNEHWGT